MDPVWWVLIVSTAYFLLTILWTTCVGVIPPLIAVIISYYAAKLAANPIIKEAKRIERYVRKAAEALGVGKDFIQQVRASKGGSVKPDPIGDFLNDKTGGLFGYFQQKGKKGTRQDPDRVQQIVEETAQKHGLSLVKKREDVSPSSDVLPIPK